MDIWGILGIPPTDDVSVIKKAYAQKLKIHHPEDDPEGYQRLREAYDSALKHSKQLKAHRPPAPAPVEHAGSQCKDAQTPPVSRLILPDAGAFPGEDIQPPPHIHLSEDFIDKTPSIEELSEAFIKRLEDLYTHFFSRIDVENWKALLDCDIMWDIRCKQYLNNRMLSFLSNHHHLPQDVWKLLDRNFNWTEQEGALQSLFHERFIQYVLKQIKQPNPLRYSFFKDIDGIDFEKFLTYREDTLTALHEHDMNAARLRIEHAREIYPDDPDLLYMEGEWCSRTGDIDGALSALGRLLEINPGDVDGLHARAKIYYERDRFQESIEDYRRIQAILPRDTEVLLFLSKCFFKLKDFDQAKEFLLKTLELNPADKRITAPLAQVNSWIESRLRAELRKDRGNPALKQRLKLVRKEMRQREKDREESEAKNDKPFAKVWKKSRRIIAIGMSCFIVLAFVNQLLNPQSTTPSTPPDATPAATVVEATAAADMGIVLNTRNIGQMGPEAGNVRANLTDIISLDLLCVNQMDSIGRTKKVFISLADGKEHTLSDSIEGWVYAGKLNDKELIFVESSPLLLESGDSTSPDSVRTIIRTANSKSLSCTGTIYDIPSGDMLLAASVAMRQKNIPDTVIDSLITSKYMIVDSRFDFVRDSNTKSLPPQTPSFSGWLVTLILAVGAFAKWRSRSKS